MANKNEPCSICEEYIEGVICDKYKCPVAIIKGEVVDLFFKLQGVMHSVDKWLVVKDTSTEMVIVHRDTGRIRTIQKG